MYAHYMTGMSTGMYAHYMALELNTHLFKKLLKQENLNINQIFDDIKEFFLVSLQVTMVFGFTV